MPRNGKRVAAGTVLAADVAVLGRLLARVGGFAPLLALALSACGSPSESVDTAEAPQPRESEVATEQQSGTSTAAPTEFFTGERATTYTSLGQLWTDSAAIVRGRVTAAEPIKPDAKDPTPFPATQLAFEVTELLLSKADTDATALQPQAAIVVRQYGTTDLPIDDGIPVLLAGKEYVLFVDQLEFVPGEPTDQWVIAGAAGAYQQADGGELRRLDPLSTGLPAVISSEELVGEASKG